LTFAQDRFEVRLKPMTDEELNRQFFNNSQAGPKSTNPYTFGNTVFWGTDEEKQRFTVFRLGIKNYAYPKVKIDPSKIVVKASNKREYWSLNFEQLDTYYRAYAIGYRGNEYARYQERRDLLRRTMLKDEEIGGRAAAALEGRIQQHAPFFRSPHWRVERRDLAAGTARAAKAWRRVLDELGATVLGNEQWLRGEALGIPIVGKADLVLGIGNDYALIVDYKWSKSYDRRIRMERGYESQASLYREIARNGGIQARRGSEPGRPVGASLAKPPVPLANIGIVYFTMRDEVCLSDSEPPGANRVTGWLAIEGDVAGEAIGKIRHHLGRVRKGEIEMNYQGDREAFKKDRGVTAFALDLSPLVELFAAEAAARDS